MAWYHVTQEPLPPAITEIREPKVDPDLEPPGKRFCVAATVWQCLVAVNALGKYRIYEIGYDAKTQAERIADGHITGERNITEPELTAAGGSIPTYFRGFVHVSPQLLMTLKVHQNRGKLPWDSEEERQSVWQIKGGEWFYSKPLV